jgi:hypothetical protein
MQKRGVYQSKNGSVCPDTERKSKDSHGGEPRTFAKDPPSIAQILDRGFDQSYRASLAAFFFDTFDSAKLDASPAQRFFSRHSVAH